jgi:hypothetical protein
VAKINIDVAGLGGACGAKKELIGRAHMAATREREGITAGMHKPKEKAPFGEYAKASRATWAEWGRWWPAREVGRHGLSWVARN